MEVELVSSEYQAADLLLRLHGLVNFGFKDDILYVNDADYGWTCNKKRIHKILLTTHQDRLGKWLKNVHLWNKVYYMLGIIVM